MTDSGVLYGSLLSALLIVAFYVWVAASLQAVFSKAGEEGWKAWVPILNSVTLLQLGGVSGWWLLILLVPVLGWIAFLIVAIIAYQRVNLAFGFGAGMTVLAVILLPVWSSVVGWGSARWLGLEEGAPRGPVRQGDGAPLDSRVVAPTAYGVPPRPPAPVAPPAAPAAPVAAPAAASAAYAFAPAEPDSEVTATPMPAFRSTARAAAAAAAIDDAVDPEDRVQAPLTPTAAPSYPPASGPAAPVQTVPPAPAVAAMVDPWAPPVGREPMPAGAMRATRYSPAPEWSDHFDTSAEVSAVAGAPTLGEPRSARESVSAQHGESEIPDAEAAFDETILASRRRTAWMLTPPLGAPIAVTSDVLIIGRRPGFDADFADAQLVPISDETRTMSKTHARLEQQGDSWAIVDLDSTNGVILIHDDGSEIDATPGVPERLTERFLLGDAELRLAKQSDEQ